MIYAAVNQNPKLVAFLKKYAPPSIIEKGINSATQGNVTETSKTGNKISGNVKESDEETHHLVIDFFSKREVQAQCTCCSAEDMHEQWCHHAIALLWKATDLGFFDANSGFDSNESTYRMNASSPQDVASVIADISRVENSLAPTNLFSPEVTIYLDLQTDRLGVKLFFDGEAQGPAIFENVAPTSSRSLDNLLLQMLDDEGSWDDFSQIWYVNSSNGIEKILGLIQEYDRVFLAGKIEKGKEEKVIFEKQLLNARLAIDWQHSGAELTMEWLLPDGTIHQKNSELLGNGPFWTSIDNTLYRLSPTAARIASIFSYSSRITLTKGQCAPVLEALNENLYDPQIIEIKNAELQPDTEIIEPTPVMEFFGREASQDHFEFGSAINLTASLEFEYPPSPKNKNLVYLPDREKERAHVDLLKSLGFAYQSDKKRYTISGDMALDLLQEGEKTFPDNWEVKEFDNVRSSVKFAELSINLSISDNAETNKKGTNLDWFDCHVSLIRNNANVPLSTIFKGARGDNDRWVSLDNGAFARVPGGSLNYLKTTLGILDPNFRLSNTIKTKLNMAQAVSLSRIEDTGFNLSLGAEIKSLANKFKNFRSITPIKATKSFKGKLRSYQEDGLSWLNFLNEFELGGILADEMGLGKTVQTLALFQFLKESKSRKNRLDKPALIVAPTSVITNWLYEARRFTPELKVLLLHGPNRKQHFTEIDQYDIVITSYALLRIDRYDLEKHEFSFCILDEAQNIKNSQAATTKAAKGIRARRRLALSGTPTENRPMELWSIMDFLMPGYLGSVDFFRNYIEKPILEGGPGVQVAKFLNSKTRPFILRRTKAEVEKDLPPKIESVLHVDMTPSQKQLYGQILEEVRPRVFEAIQKKGVRGASISILAALLRLRQVCNHPNSIESLKELPGFDSGKFNLLKDLVEEALDSGRKILLFSQFKQMLSITKDWLTEKEIPYLYLDGASKNRQDLVDQFNNDNNVRLFLISLKAGGTGLNLTGADTVIIYDPWWNPAVESQAVDRAHRIGQSKTVSVYRLVTENSIEQKIMALKDKKSKIVEALINENGLSTVKLSQGDIEQLFSPFPEES